jgi:hypothetical protein
VRSESGYRAMAGGGGASGSGAGAGGGGVKAAAKVAKKVKTQAQSKTNCLVCRLTTNIIPSNRAGGVQCRVCDSWFHPLCAQLSAEVFGLITKWAELGQESPWKCQSCERAGSKILKIVDALSSKVVENEKVLTVHSGRLDRVEDKEKVQDMRLDCQEKEIKDLREQLIKIGDLGGPSLVREMDERNQKQNNLIFHRVLEARGGDAKSRIHHDRQATQQLLNAMGVGLEVGVESLIKTVRRMGARSSDTVGEGETDPRPMLVGFAHQFHSELVLENSWRLAEADNMSMRSVSVVKDLTMMQRAGERELHKEAAKKNLARSNENIEGGLVFKVKGKRGSKREILAPLLEGEHINTEGAVVWSEGFSGGRGTGTQARGGRRTGSSAASYPNCEPVGRSGGTRMGLTPGTAQGQRQGQSAATRGRGGVRGRGGGLAVDRVGRRGDYLGEEEGAGGGAGRRGNIRPREVSTSPRVGRGPPGKKTDNKASPRSDTRSSSSTPLIDFGQDNPNREEGGVKYDEFGEVVDDAVEVVDGEEEEVFQLDTSRPEQFIKQPTN